jgi:hypothetical protein
MIAALIAAQVVALGGLRTNPSEMPPNQDQNVTVKEPIRELGAVRWQRRLEPALQAAADGKPVLLLFQEVPG